MLPYGRSEEARTPDILLPKQARYQLRYTPILNIQFSHEREYDCAFVRPACGAQSSLRLGAPTTFDRYASLCSLNPPQAVVATSPKAGALPTALHPDTNINFLTARILYIKVKILSISFIVLICIAKKCFK